MMEYSFTEAFNQVKATMGGVSQTIQSGISGVRDAVANIWESLKASVAQLWDSIRTAVCDLWDTKPWIIIAAGAALVLTVTVWGPILLRLLMNIPRTAIAVIKLPFVFLGLAK